jgi:hypothetical protein
MELTFKKNGEFEKKAIKGIATNGSYSMEKIYTTKDLSIKEIDQVHDLLDAIESKLKNPELVVAASNVDKVLPKHRHLIRLKQG